ncbi:MAG: hypothetical protein ACR5LA_05470 [Wolbachia sp.]
MLDTGFLQSHRKRCVLTTTFYANLLVGNLDPSVSYSDDTLPRVLKLQRPCNYV